MGKWTEAALKQREVMDTAAAMLSDEQAATVPTLYKAWEAGIAVKKEERRLYKDKLYKCRQAHTTQADWAPDLAPALWEIIDVSHAGTIDDPIPAERNMEYTYFLYYLDPEDGLTYLCQYGDTQTEGSVSLAYLPHEVPTYFKVVSA